MMEKKQYIIPELEVFAMTLEYCIALSTGDDDDERGPQSAPAYHEEPAPSIGNNINLWDENE